MKKAFISSDNTITFECPKCNFLGDKIIVEFHLDDKNRSLIKKECIIKKDFGFEFGIEFISVHPSDPSDRAIGFYMF